MNTGFTSIPTMGAWPKRIAVLDVAAAADADDAGRAVGPQVIGHAGQSSRRSRMSSVVRNSPNTVPAEPSMSADTYWICRSGGAERTRRGDV